MDACMNKKQQVPEYQQSTKPQCNMHRNENVPILYGNISKFCLIPSRICHQMTRWKHHQMNHLIQVQVKTKQVLDILL